MEVTKDNLTDVAQALQSQQAIQPQDNSSSGNNNSVNPVQGNSNLANNQSYSPNGDVINLSQNPVIDPTLVEK